MDIQFRPLGKAMNVAASTGLEVTYVYDDLIFADKSVFIIQFDKDDPNLLLLFFNADCDAQYQKELTATMRKSAVAENFKLQFAGYFSVKENHIRPK